MNDLPINWTCAKLGEVTFDFQAGFACGKKDVKDGLVHLRMNNIDVTGNINTELIRRVPVHLAKDHHYLQKGDILFCSTNSSKLVGKCAVFELNEKAAFSNHLTRLRVNPEIINNKLLQLYLWNFWKKGKFENRCKHWVNQSTLPKTELLLTEILLPPINEQRRIVAKLEKLSQKVDACKDRLDKIPTILKRFRQSILAAACSGRLTENWREKSPDVDPAMELLKKIQKERKNRYEKKCEKAKLEGGRKPKKPDGLEFTKIDDSRLPEIPENWCWAHLQNLGELSRGRSKHRPRNDSKLFGGKYPFIQTGDVARSNGFIKNHNQTYNETGLAQSRLFPQDTLCITIAANIADTGIITYPACFPDSIVGFIPEEGMFEVLFAMYYVRIVQNDLQTFAPATAQKNINLGILHQVAVPAPPLTEQHEIVHRVGALFKIADQIEERYKKAKAYVDKLTQSILAKAFRGELVPQDLNDEPASELLKRIQEGKNRQTKKREKKVKK